VLRALRLDPAEPYVANTAPVMTGNLTISSSTGVLVVPRLRT
jgi:hypothetical protein